MHDENNVNPENLQGEEKYYSAGNDKADTPAGKKKIDLNTILTIILLIGLVVLYILFFTLKRSENSPIPMAMQKTSGKSISVVFVNIDSVNSRYEYVKVLKSDLEGTGKRLQAEILAEQTAFEKEATDFQKQVQANAISEDKAKIIYEALMQKQQALVEKKDRYTQQVAEKEMEMNMRLLDTVTNFLKRYNRKYNYDYIMGFKTAGEILIANDTLDITKDVISSLNTEYNVRKK
jgi:outer membrane protein